MSEVSFTFPPYSTSPSDVHAPVHDEAIAGNLTCVIRTDADAATEYLRDNIVRNTQCCPKLVAKVVGSHYERWGKSVVKIIGKNMDYTEYDPHIKKRSLQVHFFRYAQSSQCVVYNAMDLLKGDPLAQDGKYLMVSLDDMIRPKSHNFLDMAFSRKFDRHGRNELGYVARPGYPDLSSQILAIKEKVDELRDSSQGLRVPLVFLEDNVRRSKMINWVIDQLEKAGVFESAYVAGLSTCFCSADVEERKKVQFEGKSVPIVTVAHYSSKNSDVITPRDLFFDGLVVEIDDHVGRLPALFMDVAARFKISSEYQDSFKTEVALANIVFCMDIKKSLGVDIPLTWMEHGKTIAKAIGVDEDSLVVDAFKTFIRPAAEFHPQKAAGSFGLAFV